MSVDKSIVDKIKNEIIKSGRDVRYGHEAYRFVLQGLEMYIMSLPSRRHVTGQELALGLLHIAHKQFGLLAPTVLAQWGICATKDFGNIVYNLIGIGLLGKTDKDKLEDFFDAMDLNVFFASQNCFIIDREYVASVRGV